MEVFAVTVFVSLMFAILFATLFLAERSQRGRRSLEQDALLPLDDGLGDGALVRQRVRAAETQRRSPLETPPSDPKAPPTSPLTSKVLTL